MKWFKDGLTKDELTREYRTLAKMYHPDVSKDPSATEKMKEINNEYDKYFVAMRAEETGYNTNDIYSYYQSARKSREIILAFLRKDKNLGKGFFTFNEYGKIMSDDSETWDGFHGGFAVCQLEKTTEHFLFHDHVKDQKVKRLNYTVEFPNFADMYFGLQFGQFTSDSTEVVDPNIRGVGERADIDRYGHYNHIYNETYGDIWETSENTAVWNPKIKHYQSKARRYAYMKVNNRIMRCNFDLNPQFFEVVEGFKGYDFGFLAFQECTREEFYKWHDVDYTPELAPALDCKRLGEDDLYWIEDPMIAHFARVGLLYFFQSKINFKLRYGSFDSWYLNNHIQDLSIDDAEEIQDFLDKLNKDFEDASKGMAKKGKLKIDTSYDKYWWIHS